MAKAGAVRLGVLVMTPKYCCRWLQRRVFVFSCDACGGEGRTPTRCGTFVCYIGPCYCSWMRFDCCYYGDLQLPLPPNACSWFLFCAPISGLFWHGISNRFCLRTPPLPLFLPSVRLFVTRYSSNRRLTASRLLSGSPLLSGSRARQARSW